MGCIKKNCIMLRSFFSRCMYIQIHCAVVLETVIYMHQEYKENIFSWRVIARSNQWIKKEIKKSFLKLLKNQVKKPDKWVDIVENLSAKIELYNI